MIGDNFRNNIKNTGAMYLLTSSYQKTEVVEIFDNLQYSPIFTYEGRTVTIQTTDPTVYLVVSVIAQNLTIS